MTGFLFVDRIAAVDPGRRIEGGFAVPADLAELSPCLVAEAIGQLAAWAAMAQAGFTRRPVAALAATVDVRSVVRGGASLILAAALETCDADAVAYNGTARVDGNVVLELSGCVGAMMAMEEFDDPRSMRERFDTLKAAGVVAGRAARFPAVAAPSDPWAAPVAVPEYLTGHRVRATLRVPQTAPYFADHFPRQPVFPATLLLDAQLRLAQALVARHASGATFALPMQVNDVKLRSFIVPGQELNLSAEVLGAADGAVEIALLATSGGRRVASARWHLPVPERW